METQTESIHNPVNWFEIYVDDINRAKKFYEFMLEVQFQPMVDPTGQGLKMLVFPMDMNKPGASGAIIQMDGMKAGGNSTLVYFSCDDCAVEESRVPAAGGKIFKPKLPIGEHGFISLCYDTEGNMFGLHSMK